jgi:acetoacetate decarboxylase
MVKSTGRLAAGVLTLACMAGFWVSAAGDDPAVRGTTSVELPRQFAPLYPAPPYPFRDSAGMMIRFKTDPEVARKLVPAPLVANPDGSMWLFVGHQKSTTLGAYNEAALGIAALHDGKPVSFALVLYLDEVVPIAVGRELTGWNKKDARVTLTETDGLLHATVERAGAVLVRATFRRDRALDPEVLDKVKPVWIQLKEIPSATPRARPDVLQLVRATPLYRKTRSAFTGCGTLEFGGSPADPLDMIPIREIVGATYTVTDQDLAGGEVIHDYLKQGASAQTSLVR